MILIQWIIVNISQCYPVEQWTNKRTLLIDSKRTRIDITRVVDSRPLCVKRPAVFTSIL